MSSYTIQSAMPRGIALGIDDQSARQVPLEPVSYPQHLAFVPLFTQKGVTVPEIVSGSTRDAMYGTESFNERGIYATHATVLSNVLNESANAQMICRLEPADAGPNANVMLYADVLETPLDEFERNVDGSIKLDVITRLPKVKTVNGIAAGLKIRFGLKTLSTKAEFAAKFAAADVEVGTMTNTAGEQSVLYPLWQGALPWFGDAGNLVGMRMWAPTDKGMNPINRNILSKDKVYPFRFAFVTTDNASKTPRTIDSAYGDSSIEFTFKPDVTAKTTGLRLSIQDALNDQYKDSSNPNVPEQHAPMSMTHVYEANVRQLLKRMMEVEKVYAGMNSDITATATGDDMWLMNPLSAVSSFGVPYTAIQLASGAEAGIRLTETADHFAMSGFDGTMTPATFDALAAEEIAKFGNPSHQYSEMMRYPVSDVYDTGYAGEHKRTLAQFIAERKDLFVTLSTHTVGEPVLSAAERSSIAVMLSGYLTSFPESEYYGTAACRGMVVGSSGFMLNRTWSKRSGNWGRLPLTLWMAGKAALYMGAGNGKWKTAYRFDSNPGNVIDNFEKIDVTFTPDSVRHKDWSNGMIYPQYFDTKQMFFAGLQTVYSDDTSILNGYLAVKACCYLEKIGYMAWRQYTGNETLKGNVLEDAVKRFVEDKCIDLFDDKFTIVARCYHTKLDTLRGYSFHTEITIYGENMTTVMTYNLVARRSSDLTTTA